MIRFDDTERTVRLAVRDLLHAGEPRGHLTLEVVRAHRSRLVAGQEAHIAYQEERSRADPHFTSEVTVRRQEVVGDWTVTVQGRVDGLVEGDGHWVVEEVKSTALDAGRLYVTGPDDWGDYVDQLRIYLWMVARDRPAHRVSGRLVLVSLADGARHVLGVTADVEAIGAMVQERLADLVQQREERLAWMSARRALRVRWPHTGHREGQEEVVQAVRDGLAAGRPVFVEAPTGLGKTVAVLTAVLEEALKSDRQVFWATTRTTQQPVVLATLEALAEAGTPVRAVALNAREKVCLNEVDGVVRVDCRPEACAFARDYYEKRRSGRVLQEILGGRADRERLRAVGQAHAMCPYQLARDAAPAVDVVVGDLNYVFDPGSRLRELFDAAPDRWVVICDEAHQLVERVRGYRSPRITARMARAASAFLEQGGEAYTPFAFIARRIEDAVVEAALQVVGPVRGHEGVAEIPLSTWTDLGDQVDEVGLDYALLKADRDVPIGEDPWLDLARTTLRFVGVLADVDESSRVLVEGGRSEAIRIVCLDPSDWLRPQLKRLGGFVAASATLRPLAFHTDLLGLSDRDPLHIAVGSPFPPENLEVVVASRVSTAYRDRRAHAGATAQLLEEAIRAVPGNVAVFFSSFAMLENLVGRWTLDDRTVLAQPRTLSERDRASWLAQLAHPEARGRPVVLAAVLGGIFAEGVDLPPGALSAVLVCGPAFPPVGLERDLLRTFYDERYDAGFLYASLVPGVTKVVQAAGRLIRRPEDRGVVALVGRRFRWRDVQSLLPARWHPTPVDAPADAIRSFFAGEAG